jgi:mannose-6-phosphate isomerase
MAEQKEFVKSQGMQVCTTPASISGTAAIELRPWGSFTILEEGQGYKIKRLEVKSGHRLSLQMHNHRSEHWLVVCGTALVTCDGKEEILDSNQSTYAPAHTKHRLENPGVIPLVIIEVQNGEYLGEDDIVRFEDDYSSSFSPKSSNSSSQGEQKAPTAATLDSLEALGKICSAEQLNNINLLEKLCQILKTMSDNPKVQMQFNAPVYGAAGNVEGNQNINAPEQDLSEAAIEVQQLLNQLAQADSTTSEAIIVNSLESEIKHNPTLKARLINALKSGGIEALKAIFNHPLVNVPVEIIKGFLEAEEQ